MEEEKAPGARLSRPAFVGAAIAGGAATRVQAAEEHGVEQAERPVRCSLIINGQLQQVEIDPWKSTRESSCSTY